MNRFVIGIVLILFMQMSGMSVVYAGEMNKPPRPEGHMKPPPEAIAACKGKSEGTTVQFTTPRGDTLKGVCKQFEGILAAMPERPPQGKPPDGAEGGPPAN